MLEALKEAYSKQDINIYNEWMKNKSALNVSQKAAKSTIENRATINTQK